MLSKYIQTPMRRACYEKLDNGSCYREIPELDGMWANERTLEACRDELQSALEDWIMFSLVNSFPIPPLDGISLTVTKVA
jgi:predicted RNase H-like HicB family nuclease